MYRILLLIPILFLSFSLTALGQSSDDNSGEDPFRNDPFFSKPIQEFFQNSSEDSAEEVSSNSDKEIVQYRLNQLNENGIDYDGLFEAGPYNSVSLYSLYPNLPMIHYNRVSGLFLGIENERMQWYGDNWLGIPSIQTTGLIGYSFAQKEWNYSLGLEKLIGRKKYMMLGAEYHDAMATDDFWRIGLTETTLTSFFAGYDYQDYYKQQGYGLYVLLRSRRLFEGGVSFNDNRYSSLITKTDWALFGSGNRYRENPPIEFIFGTPVDTLNISSLSFSGSFNPKRLVLSRHFTFSLSGMVEIADPGITSSDYDYTKYIGELATYINFEPGGVLKYRLMMGSITGNAPNFKEFQLGGVGSLRALPYKSLAGNSGSIDHYANQMILSNAEIQFGSPSYNNDSWIDFEDFYLSFFLDSGWANYSADLADNSSPFTDFDQFDFSDLRHNGGIGLGSSLIRCELAWDLNETSRSPVFWIRFNPTF